MLSIRILRHLLLLITLTFAQTIVDFPDGTDSVGEEHPWRLPNTTYPLRYFLHLTTQVHREIFNYQGNCTIEILVQQSTDKIVLHAKELEIVSVSLLDLTTQTAVNNLIYTRHEVKDLLIIKNDESSSARFLRNHRLRLTILYTGVIKDDNIGFHMLSYVDANNNTVFGANTQFEPTYARIALPCYDEPSFKSNFTVRLTHGSNYTAISNMPQVSIAVDSIRNMTTTTFMETPPMSTYLLAFVISNYANISSVSEGILQRVFLPPHSKKDSSVFLKNAMNTLNVLGDYLNVPFVLPKLDHIEVRESFGNAMENWGLITYNDVVLNRNDNASELNFIQAFTQSHELTHQWFGNLVTPAWWSSLWLSEGFATYYSYVLTKMVNNDDMFNSMDSFNQKHCQLTLSLQEMIPISKYVETPNEIMESFGFGVYAKAPCFIQMFDHAFGQKVFRKGVSNFIKTHAYSVVNEDNLFDSLQSAVLDSTSYLNQTWNYNVHEIMKTWTHSGGLPFVIITRNYDDNSINIRQRRDCTSNKPSELWWIPINFATASQPIFENTKADFYMPPISQLTISLSTLNITLKNNDWLIANLQGIGLYAVNYDAENLRRITSALLMDHKIIHRLNRANVLQNIRISWKISENVDLQTVFELLKYLPQEEDAFVLSSAIDLLVTITNYLKGTQLELLWKSFARNLISPIRTNYISKPDSTLCITDLMLKKDLNDLACKIELAPCEYDVENDEQLIEQRNTLNELCLAVQLYSDEEFEQALQFHMKYNKSHVWSELGCTKSEQQYEKLLFEAFNITAEDDFNRQEKLNFLETLLFSNYTKDREITGIMWDQYIWRVFNSSTSEIEDFCNSLISEVVDIDERLKDKVIKVIDVCKHQEIILGPNSIKLIDSKKLENKEYFLSNINYDAIYKWLEMENKILSDENNKKRF